MKKRYKSKDAFVLLIALAFISLLALGSTFLLNVSSQKAYTELRRTQSEMARIIAESGVHISVSAIQRGDKSVVSDFDPIEIGDGTATIEIEESGDASSSSTDSGEKYYDLTSTGTWGSQTATVGVLLRVSSGGGSGDSGGDEYFDGSVFCGGDFTMSNGAYFDLGGSGSVHANGTITLNGGARLNAATVSSCSGINQLENGVYITGNVAVPQKPQVAYGTLTTFIGGSVTVDPDMSGKKKIAWINTDPFRLLAVEKDISWPINGEFPSPYTFTDSYISEEEQSGKGKTTSNEKLVFFGGNGTVAPDGGVLWVEGNVTFSGSCKVKGCVIATGTITVEGGTTHEPVNSDSNIPSFMSLDGDVNINEGRHVYGLVYADKGNINVTGGGTIHGAYLARNGNFSCTEGGSVTARGSLPTGPNKEDVTMPNAGNSTVTIERWFK